MPPIVRPLTGAEFYAALQNRWVTAAQIEATSPQARYVFAYLQNPEVGATCFVIEEPYVDGDYLEDYASFYVSSFPPYGRYCKRLHFFDREFNQEQIARLLSGPDAAAAVELKAAYVGFIVVRPLPEAVIGRTVLRTFNDDGGRRHFPTVREYRPHLNGVELPIQSLAFEQQDSSVAACATVALWSAFHKTHVLFGSSRPRPAAITRAANVVRAPWRAMPSDRGLNVFQVGEAIRSVGLEPEIYSVSEPAPMLASIAYAYLSANIPLILVVFVEQQTYHAVTVVGYSQLDHISGFPEAPYRDVVSFPGQRIDKLYVHDDGIGPFAMLPIEATPPGTVKPDNKPPPLVFRTDWPLEPPAAGRSKAHFMPDLLIVPAYPKIRVSFFTMHDWLARLMRMFTTLRTPFLNNGLDVNLLSWSLRLSQVNEFKAFLRSEPTWQNQDVRLVSEDFLPRFLWIATMRYGGDPHMMIIADATDTKRTCPVLRVTWLNSQYQTLIQAMFEAPHFRSSWELPLGPRFYDAIRTGEMTMPPSADASI